MATIYSLICFGGRTGKTVTFTDAGYIVNLTNHGLRNGKGVAFSTTGSLPTGLTAGTTYYARQGADANKFLLFPTSADAIANTNQVTFSGTGAGTHTVKGAYFLGLSSAQLARYGDSGSERIYDSLSAWNTARAAAAKLTDVEFCELGENFVDTMTAYSLDITVAAAEVRIETTVDGQRSDGFHAGVIGAGYTLRYSNTNGMALTKYNIKPNGFTITPASASITGNSLGFAKTGCFADRMILLGASTSAGTGTYFGDKNVGIRNSLITGFGTGLSINQYMNPTYAQNNTITKNGYGIKRQYDATSNIFGFYYNNIVVGNITADWGTQPSGIEGADKNAGPEGTAWVTGTGSRITLAASDFYDYTNNDFRPALSTSPQVDSGVEYYGIAPTDISDDERPNYNNGGAEAFDVGCYEFDHGYGPHPASTTVTFSGVNAGSEIRIYDASANELAGVESASANHVLTWTLTSGDVRVVIVHPNYKIKEFSYTPVSGAVSLPVQQDPDKWYSNP